MGRKPWCGIGMGTIMTPYSGYGYGGVEGLEDLRGISLLDISYLKECGKLTLARRVTGALPYFHVLMEAWSGRRCSLLASLLDFW